MFKKLMSKIFGNKVTSNGSSTVTQKGRSSKSSNTGNHQTDGEKKLGQVKFLNRTKGYGFIKSNQTEKDVFVHFDDAVDFLKRGDKVQFEVEKSEKGLRARKVVLMK